MVNVVGHQPTLKAEVPFQAISCRIYGGEGGTGRFFSKYLFLCVIVIPPVLHIHSVTVTDAIYCPLLTAMLSNTFHLHMLIMARHIFLMLLENPGLSR